MPDPAPLDYARPLRRRRWGRVITISILLLVVSAGAYWRQPLTTKARLLYWQRQCLNYTRPPGTPVSTTQPSAAVDADYAPVNFLRIPTPYVLSPKAFRNFEAEQRSIAQILSMRVQQGMPWGSIYKPPIIFLHERTSPAGHRRLVQIECGAANALRIEWSLDARVIEPATLTHSSREVTKRFQRERSGRFVDAELHFGQPDPTDPSHFTIDFTAEDRRGTVDGWLHDDDSVTFKLRDPATTRGL